MKPKKGTQFTRHCPDPETINLILLESMGSSQKLTDNDKICLDCYKSHIATLNSLGEVLTPNELLESDISTWEAEAGAFSVSLIGIKGHSAALDEAHEMCINKDMKAAVARPTEAYLQKTSLFLRYRIAAHKNLLKQVYLSSDSRSKTDETLFSTNMRIKENVCTMVKTIKDFNLLPHNMQLNRGVVNTFSGIKAVMTF